uniref:G_PROTEIN_RECEP_F1_2 domain-containing protein n=1 Tax=Elaeophora elaphi TaxID=1147741 RepID=A0A0R3RP06_9BILA
MIAHSFCIIVLFLILPLNCHEDNRTKIFDIRDDYNKIKRYLAITLFSLLILYGTVSNVLLTAIFYDRKEHYNRPFVFIAAQIIICSFLNFATQILIVIREMIKNEASDAYKSTWIHRIFAPMNTFSFFATLYFTFLLAVNRFVVICLPKCNNFFESVKFYALIVFVWLAALGTIHH